MSSKDGAVPQKCLACHARLETPIVCQGCHTLYPLPKSVDYFGLLGLPRRYDLDTAEVSERFVSVSRHVHPDYFGTAGDEMRSLATRLTAELNDAVKVLSDPVLRAAYLLETSGGPSAAEDRGVPADVLSDAMALREEIDEALASRDEKAQGALRAKVETKQMELMNDIAELARLLPRADQMDKVALRRKINAAKYYNNMLDLLWAD
jgi:molecular chaperone HscB